MTLAEPGLPPLALKSGDAVVVPRGVPYYWRLGETEWVKKYYVIFDKSDGPISARYSHIVKLPPIGARDSGVGPRRDADGKATAYETERGERAGLYAAKTGALPRPVLSHSFAEVAFIVEGAGALALPQRGSLAFKAGDVVFAPKGSAYAWSGKDAVAYWVDFDVAATSERPPRVLDGK